MAEEKKTTSTAAKKKTTATKKTSSTKTTAKKTTTKTTKSTTAKAAAKPAASKLTAEERARKEALRKEVLEHYNKQQNYRSTSIMPKKGPEYIPSEDDEVEEILPTTSLDDVDKEEAAKAEYSSTTVFTRSTSPTIGNYSEPNIESITEGMTQPTAPTPISTNPKITSLKSRQKDPYRRDRIKETIKSFFSQDGLFYLLGFVALIVVMVIMFT